MSSADRADVVIIGAGISGLTAAYLLRQQQLDVRVLEKSTRTGGTIESDSVDGFLVERGPNSALNTSPLLGELFAKLGIDASLMYAAPASKNRYIVRNGRLHALPMNAVGFFRTMLFSRSAKFALLKEPFVRPGDPEGDESLAEFVERRLGREFLDYAIDPFVSGVYAGKPERLSVRASFPKLFELEQQYGSLIKGAVKGARERKKRSKDGEHAKSTARMFSFNDGMQTMVDALSAALRDQIRLGCDSTRISGDDGGFVVETTTPRGDLRVNCRAVLTAIPAYAYPTIEFDPVRELEPVLTAIKYPPVAVVFFGYNAEGAPEGLDGFGFLVPAKERRNILGTICNSSIFPARAPEGGVSFTTFVGGSRQPDNARLDDGALIDLVAGELRDLIGVTPTPDVTRVIKWERAIPQYELGHLKIVRAIEDFEKRVPGAFVSGNFRGGVSVSDCIKQAHHMSDKVLQHLAGNKAVPGGVA